MSLTPEGPGIHEEGLASDDGGIITVMNEPETTAFKASRLAAVGDGADNGTGETADSSPLALPADPEPEVIGGFPVHPAASVFPMIEGIAFDEFVSTVEAHKGVLVPVVLKGNQLLEGRNRVRAVELLRSRGFEIDLPTIQWQPRNGETPAEFISVANMYRRQLNDDQRAIIAAELAPIIAKERAAAQEKSQIQPNEIRNASGRNQHTGGSSAETKSVPPSEKKQKNRQKTARSTVGKVAAEAKVSHHKANQAIAVVKKGDKERIASVKAGKTKLKDAVPMKAAAGSTTVSKKADAKARKQIDHPFKPKDDFEHDALKAWVKWIETTLGIADKPRARKVLREIFKAEEAVENKGGQK